MLRHLRLVIPVQLTVALVLACGEDPVEQDDMELTEIEQRYLDSCLEFCRSWIECDPASMWYETLDECDEECLRDVRRDRDTDPCLAADAMFRNCMSELSCDRFRVNWSETLAECQIEWEQRQEACD